MRKEFVTILRAVLSDDDVPESVKELAIELMLEEIGGESIVGQITPCYQLGTGDWLPVAGYKEICKHVQDGEKIRAIKELRSVTRWGLKDSKDFIEDHWDKLAKESIT